MKKHIRIWWAMLLCLLMLAMSPVQALAAGKIDLTADVKAALSMVDGENPVAGVSFKLYKVAETDEDLVMTVTAKFAGYADQVTGLTSLNKLKQDGWKELASTLKTIVLRDKIAEDASAVTDESGSAAFEQKPGLYLLVGQYTVVNKVAYTPTANMIFLPDRQEDAWNYEVTVAPKYSKEEVKDKLKRKALVVWNDDGFESIRPEQVTVTLLRNGELYDQQSINQEKGWTYEWTDLDPEAEWVIAEEALEGYTTSSEQVGDVVTIENTFNVVPSTNQILIMHKLTGDKPSKNETFSFILTADDKNNPMPEGSVNGEKQIDMVGAGNVDLGNIDFKKPGVYCYTLREVNKGVEGYTYDTKVLRLTFRVVLENGQLVTYPTVENEKGEALENMEFEDSFKKTGKLPQTGVLWWPVPVLAGLGLAFVAVGILRRKKCEK